MAKMKIRSAEDIIGAYLLNLGYKPQTDLQKFIAAYPELLTESSIVPTMDGIIARLARKVLHAHLNKYQLAAAFKSVFISCGLAEKFGIAPLLPDFSNKEYSRIFRKEYFEAVPQCKISVMPTQEITPIQIHKEK